MPSQAWQRNTPHKDRSSWQWQQARQAALTRDKHRCTVVEQDIRCTQQALEVDHIDQTNNHELNNLASMCTEHHRIKTQHEAATARWKYREKRTPEKHPGLM
jgi:5-methylcytosine-specific restriction enzyme A